ncbi:MAG: hypothetical protein U0670_23605, partial [Anaerolineae bacterium]
MQFESTAPQPTNPLRARTVLEILDATFRLYRENFVALITLSAVVLIPITIIQFVLDPSAANASLQSAASSGTRNAAALNSAMGTVCFSSLISAVLSLIQVTVINGMVVKISSEGIFGRRLTLGQAWQAAQPHLYRMASAYFLFYIVLVALSMAIGVGSALCPVLLVLFAIVVYLAITIGAMLPPVVMLEGMRGNEAFRRTVAVARPRFWQMILLYVLIAVITTVLSLALTALLVAVLVSGGRSGVSVQQQAIATGLSTLINIFILPITPIAMTFLYYDVRVRTEGLDLALQALGPDARPES